jgi:serine/threonine protein kinase
MTEGLCKKCGKPPVTSRAGSVTSYFFQHNYCQCNSPAVATSVASSVKRDKTDNPDNLDGIVCDRCGKSRPLDRRVGSFTSFMFKELRCQCPDLQSFRRHTAQRASERRRTAHSFRARTMAGAQIQGNTPAISSNSTLPPGTVIGGVRILSVIGEGGMGVVYHAEHVSLHRQVALKVLAAELVNEQSWRRFQTEARTLAALNHHSLVHVYDLGIDDGGLPYYSMDFLEGHNLEELISERGPLPIDYAASIFLAVLDGLSYAHDHGVVHRDIKPANIFVCSSGAGARNPDKPSVKILDFGISKLLGPDKGQNLTAVGEIFGSPFYMSPEQCSGGEIDARSDIYSVGCAFYEALTGYVPFDGPSSVHIALAHQASSLPALAAAAPTLKFPAALDDVLAMAMAKEPDGRYQSASELADDITRVLEGAPVMAARARTRSIEPQSRDGSRTERESEAPSPVRSQLVVALCVFLVIGTLAAYSVYWYFSETEKTKKMFAKPPVTEIGGPSSFVSDVISTDKSGEKAANKLISRKFANWNKKLTTVPAAADTVRGVGSGLDIGGIYASAGGRVHIGQPTKKIPGKFSHITRIEGRLYRQFDFPRDVSLGHFVIPEASLKTEAIGSVRFPADVRLTFMPSEILVSKPAFAKAFQDGDVYELSLWRRTCTDENLLICSRIPGIQHLTLRESRGLTSACSAAFNNMKELKVVNLFRVSIDGSALARADCWRYLETLSWAGASKPLPLLIKLADSPRLEVVELRDADLTPAEFQALSKFANLKLLDVSFNKISLDDLKALSALPQLNVLDACGDYLPLEAAPIFARFKSLRELQLFSKRTKEEYRRAMVKSLPNIRVY